jgi:predicted nucleic acid-binding protein
MTADKRCFVDTNILLAATDRDRSRHADALDFLESGLNGETRLFANGQVFREALVVATRPIENNGLGLPPEDAIGNLDAFSRCVQILDENLAVALQLKSLVHQHSLKGKRIHDANLLATMREHGLRNLKTYNPSDFSAFEGVHCP